MILWGQAVIGLPLFYFSREGADIGIWVGEPAGGPGGSSGKGPPIPGPMPYLYAFIEAAEREAVLSHPHAGEGAEMGEGFAELLGAPANLTPYGIAFFMSEGGHQASHAPRPTRKSRMSGCRGFSEYLCFCFE